MMGILERQLLAEKLKSEEQKDLPPYTPCDYERPQGNENYRQKSIDHCLEAGHKPSDF